MFRKTLSVLATVTLAIGLLAGCSSSGGNDQAGGKATEPSADGGKAGGAQVIKIATNST